MQDRKTNHLAWILLISALLFAPFVARLLGIHGREPRMNQYQAVVLRNIACAISMYACENQGRYPPSLSLLEIDDPRITSRLARDAGHAESQQQWIGTYHYLAGGLDPWKTYIPPREFPMVVYPDEVKNEVHYYVLFLDWSIRFLSEQEFMDQWAGH